MKLCNLVVRKLIKRFCKPTDIKFAYPTFKIENLFNVKDPFPDRLSARIVSKFSCASCNACYVGETRRHFSTRVHEHVTCHRTDPFTFVSIYKFQSLVVPPVT